MNMRSPTQAKPTSLTSIQTGLLRRQCAACGEEEHLLQRRAANQTDPTVIPAIVHEVLNSPGESLDASTRAWMEPRFGHDFSRVRIHTSDKAAESARAVNALAYTVGQNVVFGAGQYMPRGTAGQRLLAHELTHVVQQRQMGHLLQPQLRLGETQDMAEVEADRIAGQVVSRSAMRSPSLNIAPAALTLQRRVADPAADVSAGSASGPQQIGQERLVTLPTEQRGVDQVVPYVIRSLAACPCRRVPETRQGLFWNPDLRNFAIAYRYCQGQTTADIYTQLQSNLTSVVTSGDSPEGRLRVGTDVNIAGRVEQGRLLLEVIGTNQGAGTAGRPGAIPAGTPGIGGRAQFVWQNNQAILFVDVEYLRRLGTLPAGTDPNQIAGSAGVRIGGVTFQAQGSYSGGEGQLILSIGTSIDAPRPRADRCYNCFCPPPTRQYRCIDFGLDRNEEVETQLETHPAEEFRYYFALNRTTAEPTLSAESNANLTAMAAQVRGGGVVELMRGYASPETTEQHNQTLSEQRALQLSQVVRQRVGSTVSLPQPYGGGELLGSRPAPTPSSRLGDIITQNGFRSAEDLSVLLTGSEIPNAELSDQFISLFTALPAPADRLALFGLTDSDAIAPQVLASINQFMQSQGRGYRPWEQFFRLLRVGIVRVRRLETTTQRETVRHRGDTVLLDSASDQCRSRAATAEAMTPGFGPIDPAALRPTATSDQSRRDCQDDPTDGDRQQGCNYTPASSGGRPTAPAVAPTPFGQLPGRLP